MTTTKTPRWRLEKLAENARKTQPGRCPQCGSKVLSGLDNDPCGAPAIADPTPVTYLQATVAHLAGRDVYAHHYGELHRLDDLQLGGGGPSLPLLLAHTCPDPDAA